MKFPLVLVLSCTVAMVLGLAGCASSEDENEAMVLKPEKAFTHSNLRIKAWKEPAIDEGATQPKQELEILVAGPRWQSKRWVKLRQGQSFEGLTLEGVDIRGDAIGDPKIGLAPVLIEDFSLKIEGGVPKQFLILRDFSGGDAVPFYSDTAHPPLKQ